MKSLIFIGLCSFLTSMVCFMPLSFISPYLFNETNNIIIQEPNGTIWSGEINHLTVNKIYLGKANWSFDTLKSLKSLALKTRFTLKNDDIDINGTAGITINKSLILDSTQFDINARFINTLQKNAKLSGSFNGFIKQALIKENILPNIDGIINWQDGAVDTPFIKLTEGDYRAVITPESENMDIQLSSKEAPIELSGNIKLQNDWLFKTNVVTKSDNPGLMTILKLSGEAQTDGSILINQEGDLKPFIGLN